MNRVTTFSYQNNRLREPKDVENMIISMLFYEVLWIHSFVGICICLKFYTTTFLLPAKLETCNSCIFNAKY